MKMMEVLGSICGVYSVTIDANEGTARVSGEVDPNVLLHALGRTGSHAELVWVKMKSSPPPRPPGRGYYDHGYDPTYGYRSIEQPYHQQYRRALPEHHGCYGGTHHDHYPMRRPAMQYPYYGSYSY
ncbi:uncharacterized protein LOC132316270 [Cornus florida]|uniref:uncharacterized protein LOC132316270 n=1 Tax=Cornus florida TaxID=4283 RepID=UPI00289BC6A2|nr:uncharacterized protein LOC132316270 [Cornus florida]